NDVLAIVEKVQEAVYNKFGVELESEVEIIN
ncbi:UDP-N-acetylenolpyruvoylglucosamine reductase, partial [Patescibacteria group bacterium]|nr:UDP-N-acetylenolpyruvoylglucosamine reductase [Patescibacteria group bacterium]